MGRPCSFHALLLGAALAEKGCVMKVLRAINGLDGLAEAGLVPRADVARVGPGGDGLSHPCDRSDATGDGGTG